MAKRTPQIIGIGLFLVLSIVVGTFTIINYQFHIITPVPEVLSIKTSPPKKIANFRSLLFPNTKKPVAQITSPQKVLGATNPTFSPSPTPTIDPTRLDIFDVASSESGKITFALLGDSMIDTLGRDLKQLKILLAQAYPNIEFNLLNYGVGATNIEYGLTRLTNEYDYLGVHYPSLISQKPDIVLIESFAYNPWTNAQGDLDRQWLTIAKIVGTLKSDLPNTKIILASTIAPNGTVFGEGAVTMTQQERKDRAQTIKSYLQNMIYFASSTKLPLVNAYHPTLKKDGEGDLRFIDSKDHIHPSVMGGQLFSHKVVETLVSNKIIE